MDDQLLEQKDEEQTTKNPLFAILSIILGYLFVSFILPSNLGFSTFIFTVLFLIFAISYFIYHKIKLKVSSYITSAIILIFSSVFLLYDNLFLKFLVLIFIIFCSIIIFSLFFISIALSKMYIYIYNYGLTLLRVYTSWFMALMAIFFVLLFIKQIFRKFNFSRYLVASFIALFFILNFSNIDARIAEYNIYQYKNGGLNEIDIESFQYLSSSAVGYVYSLIDNDNKNVRNDANDFLNNIIYETRDINSSWKEFNFAQYEADKILKKFENNKDR